MNCYGGDARRRVIQSAIACVIVISVNSWFVSCTSGGTGSRQPAQEKITGEIPEIDTSKVLGTLELYRAKRYESVEEGLRNGIDHIFKLVLYGQKLGTLSPAVGQFTYLASLDVSYNGLNELPPEISGLHYLQGFYAKGNNLTQFPEQILLLPVLYRVDLSENRITRIPPGIRIMNQLTRLSMDRNALTSIPVELYELGNLSVLELAENRLGGIPEGISGLIQLKKLDLSGNQLSHLPRELTALAGSLEELDVQGNRIPAEEIQWFVESMPETRIRY